LNSEIRKKNLLEVNLIYNRQKFKDVVSGVSSGFLVQFSGRRILRRRLIFLSNMFYSHLSKVSLEQPNTHVS